MSGKFIYVDRRQLRGKSLPNRQRLLRRISESIKNSAPDLGDSVKNQQTQSHSNPVHVAREALDEPTFCYARGAGDLDVVLPGNDEWLKGDEFPFDDEEEGQGQGQGPGAGEGEDGEDDFIVNISRDEFYNMFFDDCELPDMEQTAVRETPEAEMKPAGFQRDGNPGQLSVIRSYRNALPRRKALSADDRLKLEELKATLAAYENGTHDQCGYLSQTELADIIWTLYEEIEAIEKKISDIPLFEKVDQRYRKTERVMVKSAQAVIIMIMDVSGSMSQEHKEIARRFFTLQYAFIRRKYPNTEIRFIVHTDVAEEVDEEEFFTTRRSGGTIISPSFEEAAKIIATQYDLTQTNIYLSYAGDGDNWATDNAKAVAVLKELLPKLRHAVYAQVGREFSWAGGGAAQTWRDMSSVGGRMHTVKIVQSADVFAAFKKIYAKSKQEKDLS